MTTTLNTLSLNDWIDQFKPIPNHFGSEYGCDFGEGSCLYETFGEEVAYIASLQEQGSHSIWTLVDVDGELFITEGIHFVDRMGYLITENSYDPACFYEIDYSECKQNKQSEGQS